MMPRPKELSVVVPCYNEEEALPIFYNTVTEIVKSMGITYELVLVDDGSSDHTLDIMRDLARRDPAVRYFSFSRNFGKEAAIFAGLQQATGAYVALMDADLQDPPAYLPEMHKLLKTGEYDNVATRRATRKGEPKIRSFFARRFYKTINRMTDTEIVDGARDFRMMSRKMVNAILKVGEYNRFSKGLFSWVGFKTYWLSYDNVERVAGQTKWSFWKLLKYAIDGIINYSHAPLNVATNAGIIFTIIAFIWMIVLILKRIIIGGYNVSGWTSTMCVILFMGGIQLISIGIMGQYIARIFLETKHRPIYIVGESSDEFQDQSRIPKGNWEDRSAGKPAGKTVDVPPQPFAVGTGGSGQYTPPKDRGSAKNSQIPDPFREG